MEKVNDLSEKVVESKTFEKESSFVKKNLRILKITLLLAVFVLPLLLVLSLTGVFHRDTVVKKGECEYMGKIYIQGETFPAEDGCNSCVCVGDGGSIVCTEFECFSGEEKPVQLKLPSDIYEGQVYKEYSIEGTRYYIYQRPNMNVDISPSNNESGVLYAREGDIEWKPFIKIRELGESKNNVFSFGYDTQLNSFVLLLIDANGAGSGEGIAKLVSIEKEGDSWDLLNCFYYIPEDWNLNSERDIKEVVEEYLGNNPQYIQDISESSCIDFEIVKG